MSKGQAGFCCLLVGILWGLGFIATAGALDAFGPYQILLVRFAGAALLSWVTLWLRHIPVTRSMVVKGVVCGLFMFGGFAFQTFGLELTEAGSNAFLTAANVVIVPWLAWLVFRKRPDVRKMAACVLCFAGIGCMSLGQGSLVLRWGDLLSLTCALFFAAQIVALEWAGDENSLGINTVQLTTAAVLSLPGGLASRWHMVSDVTAVGSLFYLIVISTWVAFLLQTEAQRYIEASTASLLLCTESLWANVFAVVLLHERLPFLSLAGGVLILVSVFMAESPSRGRT